MIITAKTLITGDGKTVIQNGAVLIQNGLIEAVGTIEELKVQYPSEEITDYGDASVLPGLIDMHVHIGYWYNRKDKEEYDQYLAGYMALDYVHRALLAGVTTVRDMSSPDSLCQSLNKAVKRGFVKAPRIIHCNRAICATGGHAWTAGDSVIETDGCEDMRKEARRQIRSGAQWIKVMTSHRTPGVAEYTQEELTAVVDEAHRHQKKAAAHSSLQPSLEYCINAGFDTIEHGTDLTEDQARRMIETGLAWSPTLLVHQNSYTHLKEIIENGGGESLTESQWETFRIYGDSNAKFRKNFKAYADMGLTIVSGTDMISEGADAAPVAAELECMVSYGMEPVKAIAAGTSNCAKVLGMEGRVGILAKGAAADILVTDGNPADDIKALANVKAVYLAGEKYN